MSDNTSENIAITFALLIIRHLHTMVLYVVRFIRKNGQKIIDFFIAILEWSQREQMKVKLIMVAEMTRIEFNSKVIQHEKNNLQIEIDQKG